jgi:hypothetical protein
MSTEPLNPRYQCPKCSSRRTKGLPEGVWFHNRRCIDCGQEWELRPPVFLARLGFILSGLCGLAFLGFGVMLVLMFFPGNRQSSSSGFASASVGVLFFGAAARLSYCASVREWRERDQPRYRLLDRDAGSTQDHSAKHEGT